MSESEAAGKLTKIPGIVEAEATTPVQSVGVPRLSEKGFKTGLLDIVELKIAKTPIIQSVQNALFITFLFCAMVKSLTS
jgi:phosphoribosylcarboxyaminoimidazole (NCAIR) mutase